MTTGGDVVFHCGWASVAIFLLQQPVFAMSPHLPCISRQQALSCGVIASPVTQASIGAAVTISKNKATKVAKRRILT